MFILPYLSLSLPFLAQTLSYFQERASAVWPSLKTQYSSGKYHLGEGSLLGMGEKEKMKENFCFSMESRARSPKEMGREEQISSAECPSGSARRAGLEMARNSPQCGLRVPAGSQQSLGAGIPVGLEQAEL